MPEDQQNNWEELSEAEKQFIENELRECAHQFEKQFHRVWNGCRCKDCGDSFGDDPLNLQSDQMPSLCVVCAEYRRKSFD